MKKTIKTALAMLIVVCMALPMFVMPISAELIQGSVSESKITWTYETTTNVVIVTSTGASYIMQTPRDAEGGWGVGRYAEIREVVFKNGSGGTFKIMSSDIFKHTPAMTALTKVTIPATVTQMYGNTFTGATSFKELVVEGNAYIPGAVDLSNITTAVLSANNHRMFENTAIETIILKGGVYSAENPLQDEYTAPSGYYANKYSMGKLTTIMGPYNDEYLRKFAEDNNKYNYNYVPYGKIGTGTAWTYDEATNTVTIYGDGTGSTLTAISEDGAAYPAETTKVVIRADITAIDTNALAGLTNLKEVEFLGNAPATEGDPFGSIENLSVIVPSGATGFGEIWHGYTVSYPEIGGEFSGILKDDIIVSGSWKFDAETLYVWSNQERTETGRKYSHYVYLPVLKNDADFKAFVAGEYASQVKIIKFSNKDGSIFADCIDGGNNGLDIGLANVEQIYFGEETVKSGAYGLRRISNMFKGMNNLTTFGKVGTKEGTVDLAWFFMDGGAANGAFSGQTGIKKVTLPAANTWGLPYDYNGYSTWANIPANYFEDMTGLEEVVLSASTDNKNNGTVDETYLGAYYAGTCSIGANAFDGCTSLKSLTIPATAPASAQFEKSNGKGVARYTVTLFDANTFANSSITTVYVWNPDAAVVAEYKIPNVAKIICANDATKAAILEDTTADVSCILSGVGVSVRYEKYNGLRNIYDFNDATNDAMKGYTLVEFGAMLVSAAKLGENELTIDPWNFELSVESAINKAVWNKDAKDKEGNDNPWVGKVLSYEAGVKTQFALTLTNFTDNFDSAVYSRAYAIYEDANGNRFVAYANNNDEKAVSLYDAMVSGCLQGALDDLVCDDIAVWDVLATGKVADITVEGIEAMVVNGKTDEDAKVLVVRMTDGELADANAIAAAKAAAVAAGYDALNDTVIALDFLA